MPVLAQIQNVPVPPVLSGMEFLNQAGDSFVSDFLAKRLVTRILLFAILASGLLFFIQLLSAGFSYMTSTGDPAKLQSASKKIVNAVTGLFIVTTAYFVAQILQAIFGITIL